ncbi:13704_t:CDS:2 [Funneliformis mosseae]|uniref:13704_t:CDS:1 n=1 Tax=Funneliformis mosseae TaxID=27381 RepID=A0A9N9FJK3_FUNMO|nr:13704_t:CDS:2 [Funneliformis mosseae]
MEYSEKSERSNNISLRIPLAIKEEIFDEDIPDRSISYHTIQLITPINSQKEFAQRDLKHVFSVINLIYYLNLMELISN